MTIIVTPVVTTNQLTFLQVVNRVLTKLRQDTINTFSGAGDYVKLIGALVNEAVEEVDAAWDWNYERTIFFVYYSRERGHLHAFGLRARTYY